MSDNALRKEIEETVVAYPDFPKPGILFRDVMPVFFKPDLVDRICTAVANFARGNVDVVTALEARGFLFGPQIAIDLGLPFVPFRKCGKLPGPLFGAKYMKEYGEDVIEVQASAIKPGSKVLIVDDLLATGGTIKAAIQLVESMNSQVAQISFIIELCRLNGRKFIKEGISIYSMVQYN